MTKQLIKCPVCDEPFQWDEKTIEVGRNYYHRDCVELYPTGYCAFDGEEYLGETENDEGDPAFKLLDKGEYVEEQDNE